MPAIAREPSALPWLQPVRGDLPDVNVWVALAAQRHTHKESAVRYWKQQLDASDPGLLPQFWFCRTSMLGMVRLLSHGRFGEDALDPLSAYAVYRQYRALPEIGMVTEPPECEARVHALLAAQRLPARMWTDVWLAALAQATGLRLVTFDKDFERFGLERCLILPAT